MALEIPKVSYNGSIREIALDKEGKVVVGGESAYPFCAFEGAIPREPKIAIQVLDYAPDDWAEACVEPYRDVLADPVAWALKAQNEYGADMIQLWLKSTDPNGMNRGADEAAQTAKAVADAISVPLIVWGSNNVDKDAEVLKKVMEVCAGKDVIVGQVSEGNHKQLGAQALAYNVTVVANSPIDINLAKQLNILLNNLGVPLDKIIIDPTTGGLGYGLEYSFSVMERIRQAALTQNDDKLQCPFISNLADEVWKTKEAKLPTDEKMGDAKARGILMEAITATTLLGAGAEILVMRHPEAIEQVRKYIAELGGFEMPKGVKEVAAQATAAGAPLAAAESRVADSLKEGALCEVVQIMDMPVNLAPGHAIALIKSVTAGEAGSGLVLSASGAPAAAEEGTTAAPAARKQEAKPEFKPESTWTPIEDVIGNYKYKLVDAKDCVGKKVKLIQDSSDPGRSEGPASWRDKTDDRDEMLENVKTGLHYWYGEGFGSEKRKKPA
ncbi:MAG: acetyl-CoA decarbonylase/synthase complex subunit delta [Deltaproteobacteria bacterium]|nr:acetyl-CoA decarbonylase/synthase complex subunit delta [Deltaproteobacteria bacterium]